ncbi:hypothetical protein K502DRAFT_298643 [Neoconidiobolus thromboides FSU 785]|nr:hypothetical protein K502DRAFT_298643 [Neoconidiobolus thromboides FSU 785]
MKRNLFLKEMDKQAYEAKIKEAKDLFDQVNLRVRESIPEYNSIYTSCSGHITELEQCIATSNHGASVDCQSKIKGLRDCTNQASCPEDFKKYSQCLSSGNKDCTALAKGLNQCLNNLSVRIMEKSKKELEALATKEQLESLKGFLPI